jgi:competence protein ComEC
MSPAGGVILCLFFILGLLSTVVPWGGIAVLLVGVIAGLLLPHLWRSGPQRRIWLIAGLIGLFASFYLHLRTPKPDASDISQFIHASEVTAQQQAVTVQGQIESIPRLTRSQKARFWLNVVRLNGINNANQISDQGKAVTGKLYVTVPLLQATGLYPGQAVSVTGKLYKPEPAANPGGFDFQAYLAQEGCFAALQGQQVEPPQNTQMPRWGWWKIQQQIVKSQIRWLGSPAGPLVSSMVLGSRAVDLPYDIKDQFKQVGLAHALAASGFQTSLILGVVLALTRQLSARLQFAIGTTALIIFVGLTGLEPAVLRATLMGIGALAALVMKRKIKPLGSLLLVATLLLVFNPIWIWGLGFQLSFLATMGLLVTVPPLTKKLDWLPTAIAPLIAVPIAAYIWTLPLLLHVFGVVSPYSILVNIMTTPLISLISIGGIISALAAVIWSPMGSALAWLLAYPTQALLAVVEFFSQLSGSQYATGIISSLTMITLYGLIVLVWRQPWWQRRWWMALLFAIALLLTPVSQAQASSFRATILATADAPVMVVQDGQKVGIVNSGDEATAIYTILPFLQREGINQIDWAIATDNYVGIRSGWTKILAQLPIKAFYDSVSAKDTSVSTQIVKGQLAGHGGYLPLQVGQSTAIGSVAAQLLNADPSVLQLRVHDQQWLLLGDLQLEQQKELAQKKQLPKAEVLWWSGKALNPGVLAIVQPKVAITTAASVDELTANQLRQNKTQLYWTRQDGAIQWTPNHGFEPTLKSSENEASPL